MKLLDSIKSGMNSSQRDGVQYRTASWIDLICSMGHNGVSMCFYVLTMYASYIGNEGYGIGVALVGVILTVTKAFDGLTDALAAAIYEKMSPTHGKIRICVVIGWVMESVAVLFLFHWGVGHFSGAAGVIVFAVTYVIYTLGYTVVSICGGTASTVITNDPLQRPMVAFFDTGFSYLTPMLMNTVVSFWLLPKHDNQWNAPMLKEACYLFVAVSFVLMLITCFGVRKVDVYETFASLGGTRDDDKIKFRDMWNLLKENRAVQMYIVTCATDKLAQTTASQSVVAVMLSGILIGSYKATTLIGSFTSTVGLAFAFLGGMYVAKYGARKSTNVWSVASILISIVMIGFCTVLGKDGMSQISVMSVPMVLYIVLQLALTATKMILTATANAMRADIVDYELSRSGKYMPAVVNGVYSFISKLIASLGSTIAALCVAAIGYKTVMPQMGDKPTTALFWITMFLSFGLPIIGWLFNLLAMKFYHLDKAKMVEIQKKIAAQKAAIKAGEKA